MLISVDVGFSKAGYTIWEGGNPKFYGIIETEKTKVKGILTSNDYVMRCKKMALGFHQLIHVHKIQGVIAEAPGGSQNARAAAQLSMAMAVVATVAQMLQIPDEWCTAFAVKKAVTGSNKGSKEAVMNVIAREYGWKVERKEITISKGKRAGQKQSLIKYSKGNQTFPAGSWEHIADSIGVYWALREGNLVKIYG